MILFEKIGMMINFDFGLLSSRQCLRLFTFIYVISVELVHSDFAVCPLSSQISEI